MVLNAKEELINLLDKLPERKIEDILDYAKKNISPADFKYSDLTENSDAILNEDAELLKKLSQ